MFIFLTHTHHSTSLSSGIDITTSANFWTQIAAQFDLDGVDSLFAFVKAFPSVSSDETDSKAFVWLIDDLHVVLDLPETSAVRRELLIAIKSLCESAEKKHAEGSPTNFHGVIATHNNSLAVPQYKPTFTSANVVELRPVARDQVKALVTDFCADRRDVLTEKVCTAVIEDAAGRANG